MRRRWLLFCGGVVLIGVATVLALALLIPPVHPAPFRFLQGHEPVAFEDRWIAYYALKENYTDVVERASRELMPRGFTDDNRWQAFLQNSDEVRSAWFGGKEQGISITSDWDGRSVGRKPGWVCVEVQTYQRSVVDRIMAVFGL